MDHALQSRYDAVLFVSFGGPDKADDVLPFLENVLRGRRVPKERMLEVAEHYYHFGGKSPINEQNIALIDAIRQELKTSGLDLPVYWGNRNWYPLLTDTIQEMKDAGVRRALAFVTSGFSCYSGCRQYRENIQQARDTVGPEAPEIDKIRVFFNHPGFVHPMARNVRSAMESLDNKPQTPILFTAHSIPLSMADSSDYCKQLQEASRLVAEQANIYKSILITTKKDYVRIPKAYRSLVNTLDGEIKFEDESLLLEILSNLLENKLTEIK